MISAERSLETIVQLTPDPRGSLRPLFSCRPGDPWSVDDVPDGFRDRDHARIGLARSKNGITDRQRHPESPTV
jgi:hypothetical protein